MLKMMGHRDNWALLSCILLFAFNAVQTDVPMVRTQNGTLEGLIMQTKRGRDIVAFRGIPYAAPPLGELRFQAPQPATAWDGVRSAKDDAAICIQWDEFISDIKSIEIKGDEDCLYLNVYTPKVPSDKKAAMFNRFPVMIWFHGGGWVFGSAHSSIYGPKFLLDHDVVLVTVNYRFGPFGFLSTEDMECPGNAGLKDQAQSIRWVHENIAAFGGDPNRVTLFGESTGSASTHYQMLSPLSRGLFHRVISQSGTSHCPWAISRRQGDAKEEAKILGKRLNCFTESSKEIIACLRTKSAIDILGPNRFSSFQVYGYCPLILFSPVVEPDHPGAFLTQDPVIATKQGRIVDVPWMTGITSEEGSLQVVPLYKDGDKLVKQLNDEFSTVVPISVMCNQTRYQFPEEASSKIRKFYFGDDAVDESTRFKLIDMYSDGWFNYGAYTAVRDFFHTQSSPVYFYYFVYKSSMSFSNVHDSTRDYGVMHGDELQYLFPGGELLFPDTPLSEKDHRMIDVMTSLWFNFANSANPTPRITEEVPVKWKSVKTPSAIEYLHIGNSKIAMEQDLLPTRIQFWDNLLALSEMKQKAKDEL